MCWLLCANLGCTKFSAECDYTIMPRRLEVESSPRDGMAYQVRVYVFYMGEFEIDFKTNPWKPESWADADMGIVRNRNTGEVRVSSYVVEQGEDNFIHAIVTSSPVMFVVVDEYDKMYAWGTFKYEIPMAQVWMPVQFQVWKKSLAEPFRDGNWMVWGEQ